MLIALVATAMAATCPTVTLPASFSVTEESFTWTPTFDVSSNGGTVSGDLWSWTPTMTYTDSSGATVATAKQASFSWGVRIDVFDCNGSLVGSLQEKLFTFFSGYQTTYAILDASGTEIATSGKFGWFDTTFAINDTAGHPVATLTRPAHFVGGDTWNVSVAQPNVIDNRILVLTAAFKTEADNHKPD